MCEREMWKEIQSQVFRYIMTVKNQRNYIFYTVLLKNAKRKKVAIAQGREYCREK